MAEPKTKRLVEKIKALKQEMARLNKLEFRMLAAADEQLSLTDPDARSMTTSGRGTGMVGHHLIVTHEVTNLGHDRPSYRTCRGKPKRPSALTSLKWWPIAGENLETCQYGDEPAYAGLLYETCDEYPGHQAVNPGNTGIGSVFAAYNLCPKCLTGVLST